MASIRDLMAEYKENRGHTLFFVRYFGLEGYDMDEHLTEDDEAAVRAYYEYDGPQHTETGMSTYAPDTRNEHDRTL